MGAPPINLCMNLSSLTPLVSTNHLLVPIPSFDFVVVLYPPSLCSLISTPPPERVPIKTHLAAYSKEKVVSAIKNELDRGGQVFYVLPRIKGDLLFNDFCTFFITQ